MPFLKLVLGVFVGLGLMALGLVAALEYAETQRHAYAYEREAIKALALDAAGAFPTRSRSFGTASEQRFWSKDETPCMFTTNVQKVSGTRSRVTWDDWPSGPSPACGDFFSSAVTPPPDWDITLPQTCAPVLVTPAGDRGAWAVAAAHGAQTGALRAARLVSPLARSLLPAASGGHVQGYPYTSRFVQGGGMDGVSIDLTLSAECDGFDLFHFQAEAPDPHALRPRLERVGYRVGVK